MPHRLLDDALEEEILASEDPGRYLILDEHPQARGHWVVQSLRKGFRLDLLDVIGPQSMVSPGNLEAFLQASEELEYDVAFVEDPLSLLDSFEALNDVPSVALNSAFPDTVNGFLRFQWQGFNKLKDLPGAVAQWSTGTGKSVLAAGLTKLHEQNDDFDVCLYVVKSHNKVNAARGMFHLAGIESLILDGTIEKREEIYIELLDRLERGEKTIVITNYEKFRDDFCHFVKGVPKLHEWAERIFTSRLWIVWDEMPTKLKNRTSNLYLAVVKCLYRTNSPAVNWDRRRPKELRQIMLSATPIENDPEDWYNCIRILDPRIYGTVTAFRELFVAYYDRYDPTKPKGWRDLDLMALMASHIVHQVDKDHPDIASQFPEVIEDLRVLDWDPADRKVYDKLTDELIKKVDDEEGMSIFAALAVMQMLCNAPAIVNDSAALREAYEDELEGWDGEDESMPKIRGAKGAMALLDALGGKKLTNKTHTKIKELHKILIEEFPEEKIVIFASQNNSLMPTLCAFLEEWDVTYVRYNGTITQRQAAQDRFKSDPSVRVFLSSDAGSDSINLEEATIVINYDGPYKETTKVQRDNRIHRITSVHSTIRSITLEMWNSVDTRKRKIRLKKWAFHTATFGGVIKDEAISANTTRADLMWLLGG